MDIKNIKTKISLNISWKNIASFLNKKSHWILIIICLSFFSYCAYLWYVYITNPHWSDSQKQEYTKTKQKEILFNKGKFDEVVSSLENRKSEYEKKIDKVPDIFRLK